MIRETTDSGTKSVVEHAVDNNTHNIHEKQKSADGVRCSSRHMKRPFKFKDYGEVEFDV